MDISGNRLVTFCLGLAACCCAVAQELPDSDANASAVVELEAAITSASPAISDSPVLAEDQTAAITSLTALTDASSGVCPVISDFFLDYCEQYPDDQSCRTP